VLEFTADTGVGGHYSAYAVGSELPFYYGAPGGDCLPLDEWSMLTGVSARIDVPFDYGTAGCGLPTWQGKLDAVLFDADGNRAQFQFSTSDGYGPVLYDMWRVCPAPAGDL